MEIEKSVEENKFEELNKNIQNMDNDVTDSKTKNRKKAIIISIISIISVILIFGIILFLINRIPSQYYGSYIRYSYFNGKNYKDTYVISPISIKYISECTENGKITKEVKKIDYKINGENVVISDNDIDKYIIIDDDCLYMETSKDISSSKKYGTFYWNEKSKNADIFEIKNNADEIEEKIEDAVNGFFRQVIYNTVDQEIGEYQFYITSFDDESDKTNLNTYTVKYKAAGGNIELVYNRKTKKLNKIDFSGNILDGLYNLDIDTMTVEDLYDCRALLMACVYLLKSEDNYAFVSTYDINDFHKIITFKDNFDKTYFDEVAEEYTELFGNKKTDSINENRNSYTFNGDKYNILFNDWITTYTYSTSGIISWTISLNN